MSSRKPLRKQGGGDRRQKRRKGREAISGFSTLNQVAGVPKPREHHSSLPVTVPGPIAEPHPKCVYCGEEIESIASAFTAPDGGYAHFDCVLGRIRESEKPKEGETVSYIGCGRFALIARKEDGGFTIIREIPYESAESVRAMKEYVSSLRKEAQ